MGICKKLNAYYKHLHLTKKATLRCDYCKIPWRVAALVTTIVLVILIVIQINMYPSSSVVGLMLCSLHVIILSFQIVVVASIAPIALHFVNDIIKKI